MLTRFIFLVSLLLSYHSIQAQTAASHKAFIKRVTKQIAHAGVVDCQYIGRAAMPSRQYLRFDSLCKQATTAELTALLSHRASAVRAYAFQALTEKPEADLFPALLQHQNDTAKLAGTCGCFGFSNTVFGNMFYDYKGSLQHAQDLLVNTRRATWEKIEKEFHERNNRERERKKHLTPQRKHKANREYKRLRANSYE